MYALSSGGGQKSEKQKYKTLGANFEINCSAYAVSLSQCRRDLLYQLGDAQHSYIQLELTTNPGS